ncbi:hypothetical protein QQY24_31505 [Streptomyces sp. TG1A-8]|uniref:hypothetical protein n=1 Tax=Streptomyces sp. TG1A-8 TaxID=3051385 RepID=UPI00265C159C|nr:hypothetical protein [Streptomyces sp. TG1A-8]MDO0929666.1 hypothetical protein [Streptomyces sp. TG1A-8]
MTAATELVRRCEERASATVGMKFGMLEAFGYRTSATLFRSAPLQEMPFRRCHVVGCLGL